MLLDKAYYYVEILWDHRLKGFLTILINKIFYCTFVHIQKISSIHNFKVSSVLSVMAMKNKVVFLLKMCSTRIFHSP